MTAVNKKDDIVMKLIYYFVTNENYRPVIVRGVQNEIWLENLDKDISLIRININYIHNDAQLELDQRKVEIVRKTIKRKTLSFKMNVLNILINTRNEVNILEENYIESIKINKISDLYKSDYINTYFPDFKTKVRNTKSSQEEIFTMSEVLNQKTIKEDKKLAKIFLHKETPIVTLLLIITNIIMYLLSLIDYNFIINTFANYYVNVKLGEIYRLVTYSFVHANIIHIFFNMYALYLVGPLVENYYGKLKYIIIYIGSSILGGLFGIVLTNNVIVGASASIFGLFGSLLYFSYKYRNTIGIIKNTSILPVILLNLLLSIIIPNIDLYGHIGGLLGGLTLSYALGVKLKENTKDKINGTIIYTILIILLVTLLIKK